MKISKLVAYLDRLYPFALAESWDNVGLIVGDPKADITSVQLALDVTPESLADCRTNNANVLVTHHPAIFRAIKRINAREAQGELLTNAIRNNINLIALHTNLDSAAGGLNDTLCADFGLTDVKPLVDSGTERFYHLVTYVPRKDAQTVREALWKAGAGQVGQYGDASFNTDGIGTFRGGPNTNPTIGEPGVLESVDETRIEVLLRRELKGQVLSALNSAHPYETVAYQLYPIVNKEADTGLARIGNLVEPQSLDIFVKHIEGLGIMVTRVLGDATRRVTKVGLCSGAGSDFLPYAISAGADVYVTAEVKHHHGLMAHQKGMAVIETDHGSLESRHWPRLKSKLNETFPELNIEVSSGSQRWRRP